MRYGLAIVAAFVLIIFGSVALVRNFTRTSSTSSQQKTIKLVDFENSDSTSVSWVMQGRVVGEDRFKSIRITITSTKRTVEILDGYSYRVEKSAEFINSQASFGVFLRSLDELNFGLQRTTIKDDERGQCPTGRRFVYKLTDGSNEILRSWSTSCSSKEGSFASNKGSTIRELFKSQITDYNKFVAGVKL